MQFIWPCLLLPTLLRVDLSEINVFSKHFLCFIEHKKIIILWQKSLSKSNKLTEENDLSEVIKESIAFDWAFHSLSTSCQRVHLIFIIINVLYVTLLSEFQCSFKLILNCDIFFVICYWCITTCMLYWFIIHLFIDYCWGRNAETGLVVSYSYMYIIYASAKHKGLYTRTAQRKGKRKQWT